MMAGRIAVQCACVRLFEQILHIFGQLAVPHSKSNLNQSPPSISLDRSKIRWTRQCLSNNASVSGGAPYSLLLKEDPTKRRIVQSIMLYRIVITFSIVVPKFMANTFIKIMPYRVKILERQKSAKMVLINHVQLPMLI